MQTLEITAIPDVRRRQQVKAHLARKKLLIDRDPNKFERELENSSAKHLDEPTSYDRAAPAAASTVNDPQSKESSHTAKTPARISHLADGKGHLPSRLEQSRGDSRKNSIGTLGKSIGGVEVLFDSSFKGWTPMDTTPRDDIRTPREALRWGSPRDKVMPQATDGGMRTRGAALLPNIFGASQRSPRSV